MYVGFLHLQRNEWNLNDSTTWIYPLTPFCDEYLELQKKTPSNNQETGPITSPTEVKDEIKTVMNEEEEKMDTIEQEGTNHEQVIRS